MTDCSPSCAACSELFEENIELSRALEREKRISADWKTMLEGIATNIIKATSGE